MRRLHELPDIQRRRVERGEEPHPDSAEAALAQLRAAFVAFGDAVMSTRAGRLFSRFARWVFR